MTDIGVATRVHMREERALSKYRLSRWQFLNTRTGRYFADRRDRRFNQALVWRSRWSALREIIDAEERRAKRPNCAFDSDVNAFDADHFIDKVPA